MTSRRAWTRADDKRPITADGAPASSTNPATWADYNTVKSSIYGNGLGIMLGGGLGCYDLDHVTDDEARSLIREIPEPIIFIERSVSGEGVHVFVTADESAGTRTWQGRHERYTRERFIRVTGNRARL